MGQLRTGNKRRVRANLLAQAKAAMARPSGSVSVDTSETNKAAS